MFSMNFMYKYVDFYFDIYFGYFKNHLNILSNTCYDFSLPNKKFIIIFCEQPNLFQY